MWIPLSLAFLPKWKLTRITLKVSDLSMPVPPSIEFDCSLPDSGVLEGVVCVWSCRGSLLRHKWTKKEFFEQFTQQIEYKIQDVSTRGSSSAKKQRCCQLTKTHGSKRPEFCILSVAWIAQKILFPFVCVYSAYWKFIKMWKWKLWPKVTNSHQSLLDAYEPIMRLPT